MKSPFCKIVVLICLLVSGVVMLGWALQFPAPISFFGEGVTMKFNTALLTFLTSVICIVLLKPRYKILTHGLSISIALIAFVTLLEYLFSVTWKIDSLFIEDHISSAYPGRMSPATAFCFLTLGLAGIGISMDTSQSKKISQQLIFINCLIALIAIVGYIMAIRVENKGAFIYSMSIWTSIILLSLGLVMSMLDSSSSFLRYILGNFLGSKILKILLAYSVIVPLGVGFLLLYLSKEQILHLELGLVLFTVIYITFNILLFSILPILNLNLVDQKKKQLESSLGNRTLELSSYKKALDQSSMVSITDLDGQLIEVNNNFIEQTGFSYSDLIGQNHNIINSGYHPKSFFTEMWKTIQLGEIWTGEIKNKHKDGSLHWMHTSIVPIRDSNKNISQFLSIRNDITRLKEAEEYLISENRKLKFLNQEVEQFAYITSHDLKQPLRTLSNCLETLEEESLHEIGEIGVQCIDFMKGAAARMLNLVDGLLDYSRIGLIKEKEEINVNSVIQEVLTDLHVLIEENNARIEYAELPYINGLRTEIRLLFQNLISNAIKFKNPDIPAVVQINAVQKNEHIEFSVEDNGIGIPIKYQDKIFQMFQRLHSKAIYEGTGIGLAHCRKIVELHNGKIWVNSTPGEGSSFHFLISHS